MQWMRTFLLVLFSLTLGQLVAAAPQKLSVPPPAHLEHFVSFSNGDLVIDLPLNIIDKARLTTLGEATSIVFSPSKFIASELYSLPKLLKGTRLNAANLKYQAADFVYGVVGLPLPAPTSPEDEAFIRQTVEAHQLLLGDTPAAVYQAESNRYQIFFTDALTPKNFIWIIDKEDKSKFSQIEAKNLSREEIIDWIIKGVMRNG